MLPQIFAPIFLEKIVMQKLLQNFAQKQSENLLNAKKPAKLCGEIYAKKNGKSLNFLTPHPHLNSRIYLTYRHYQNMLPISRVD